MESQHTWAKERECAVVVILVNVRQYVIALRADLFICAKNYHLKSTMHEPPINYNRRDNPTWYNWSKRDVYANLQPESLSSGLEWMHILSLRPRELRSWPDVPHWRRTGR